MDKRPFPGYRVDERATLTGFLDFERATLAWKCADLSDDQLRRQAAPPSNLSLLGLVRHLANAERIWFRIGVAGEDIPLRWPDDHQRDADFLDTSTTTGLEAFTAWEDECELARTISARTELDRTFVHRDRTEISLRWVLVHMIEEYARHNGHADLIREGIDGVTGA